MSLYPTIIGSFQPSKKYLPRWIFRRDTPILTNEGDEVGLSMVVNNANVGSQIVLWFTGGSSLASSGNWVRSWHDVIAEALAANGCSYKKLSGSTTPAAQGTLSGLITIGESYAGQTIRFVNRSRKNRRTNVTNADGTPGYREGQFLLTNQGSSGTPERDLNGTGVIQGGNLIRVQDTSRTPEGTPTLRLSLIDAEGNPSPSVLYEGDIFGVRITTTNIRPDTRLKMYPAELGRKALSPSFRSELRRAGQDADCAVFLPNYLASPSTYYDGGEITFSDFYRNENPVTLWFSLLANSGELTSRTLHILSQLTFEGDAAEFDSIRPRGDWASGNSYQRGDWVTYLEDGGRYIYTSESTTSGHLPTETDYWRPYVTTHTASTALSMEIKKQPPRLWEIRAKEEDGTIYYAINAPTGVAGHSVAFNSTNPPAGFDAALAAAAGNHFSLENGRLVAKAGGEAKFSVPLSGTGKHTMRLTDAQGSWIVIGDTCVYLTRPTMPAMRSKYWGVNLCGGDFTSSQLPGTYGTHYVYPSQPESSDPVKKHQEMDYYWRKGIQAFRVPFKLERLQRDMFGPLYGDGGTGSWSGSQDIRRIDELVNYAEGLGIPVILDAHNYGGRKVPGVTGAKFAYDSPSHPIEGLIDFWVKMANRYAGRLVWFDFMNEPSGTDQSARRVADWHQWLLNAVRARTNATNFCLIEGQRFSSAQYWVSFGQGAAYEEFYDPARNFAFSPHNYVDEDAGGLSGRCVVGSSRLVAITNWARQKPADRKLWLGEVAGGDPTLAGQDGCGPIMKQVYDYIRDNPEWIGVTAWGGGRFTGASYWGRLDPFNYQTGEDTNCLKMLLPYVTPR